MTVGPDSKIIPEAVVEDAWHEIGGLSDEQALGHMNRVSRTQPALLTFVMTFSEDLSSSAAELATYMFRGCAYVRRAVRKATAECRSKADRSHTRTQFGDSGAAQECRRAFIGTTG